MVASVAAMSGLTAVSYSLRAQSSGSADLSIVWQGPSGAESDGSYVYTVTVINAGLGDVANAYVSFAPQEMIFVPQSSDSTCSQNEGRGRIACTQFPMIAGASRSLRIALRPPQVYCEGFNVVRAYIYTNTPETNTNNNTADVTVPCTGTSSTSSVASSSSSLRSSSSSSSSVQAVSCTDSDGGDRTDVAGTVNTPGGFFRDHCENSTDRNSRLIEYTCSATTGMVSRYATCPYGCDQGACEPQGGSSCVSITNSQTCSASQRGGKQCAWNAAIGLCGESGGSGNTGSCTDSDGGEKYDVRGSISTGNFGGNDYCDNETKLNEYFCANGDMGARSVVCPYGCSNGRCSTNGSAVSSTANSSSIGSIGSRDNIRFGWIHGQKSSYKPGERFIADALALVSPPTQTSRSATPDEGWSVEYAVFSRSISVNTDSYRGKAVFDGDSWHMDFSLPTKPGEYYTTVSFYCTSRNKPCWQIAGYYTGMDGEQYANEQAQTLPFTIVQTTSTSSAVSSQNYNATGGPTIGRVWITQEPACGSSRPDGTLEDCHDYRLWIEVRTLAGRVPTNADGVEVSLSTWVDQRQEFGGKGLLGQYWYGNDRSKLYHGYQIGLPSEFLPHTERYLIEATQNGRRSVKDVSITYTANIPQIESTNSTSSVATVSVSSSSRGTAQNYEDVVRTTSAGESLFNDIGTDTLEGKAANALAQKRVIGGYPDGAFKGSKLVNRAEAAKFLLLARYGAVPDMQNNGRFPDVLSGEWYEKFVMYAASLGIIKGHEDGFYRPANTVNTAEFLKMLTLTFELELNLPHTYLDVNSQAWFASYAGVAEKYDLFPNRDSRYLQPSREMTRTEVAVAIYRYLQSSGNISQ